MDVDNVHWPKDAAYVGDTNESLHVLQCLSQKDHRILEWGVVMPINTTPRY